MLTTDTLPHSIIWRWKKGWRMRDALSVCYTSMGLAQRLAAPSHLAYIHVHKPQKGEIFMHIVILGIVVETVLGLREIVGRPLYGIKGLPNKEILKDDIVLPNVMKVVLG